ncbi:MAG TPA: hypothetical protein VGH38_34805 [Bryobacteraceae bacterium]|jgi:hypothetical protein
MRRITNALLFTAAILSIGTLARAQYGQAGGPYQPDSVSSTVDRVHTDLDRGYEHWHISKSDRERLNKAEKRLRNFASDWRRAKFDKDDLDDSISSIQHVLDNNHLSGPERDALSDDVNQLRQMREAYDRHEIGRW